MSEQHNELQDYKARFQEPGLRAYLVVAPTTGEGDMEKFILTCSCLMDVAEMHPEAVKVELLARGEICLPMGGGASELLENPLASGEHGSQ